MSLFISIIIWILVGASTAYVASNRGRDPVYWFFIGLLLGLFGLLLLMIMPDLSSGATKNENGDSKDLKESALSSTNLVFTKASPVAEQDYLFKEWFYIDQEGKQQGSLSYDALKLLWDSQKITGDTFVWSAGMPEWKRLSVLNIF